MEQAEARQRLEVLLQWEADPALSQAEVDLLLDTARRADCDGNPVEHPWRAAVYYPLDSYVVPTVMGGNGHIYRTTTAGVSGTVEPTWPLTSSGTVVDNGVTWTEAGIPAWVPTWDVYHAAAEGWRLKAAKVATQFDFTTDGQTFHRSQQRQACLEMAESYAKKRAVSVPIGL